jgi:hypothetical protein
MKHTPKRGEVVLVSEIPLCNFCDQEGEPTLGPYDFRTRFGAWANGCEAHWGLYRAEPGLGEGRAQLWVTEDQVAK